jgi:hypothetical protein
VKEAKQQLFIHQQRVERARASIASSADTSTRDRLAVATPSTSAVGEDDNNTSQPPLTKKAKFFDFMAARRPSHPGSASATALQTSQERQQCPNLNKQFYDLHHSDADSSAAIMRINSTDYALWRNVSLVHRRAQQPAKGYLVRLASL